MQFENFQALINMDGHGIFVWSVYAVALLVLASLLIVPLRKKRRFFIQQTMLLRRRQDLDSTSSLTPSLND